MQIYFNLVPPNKEISYGGGLFFVKYVSNYLIKYKHTVLKELNPNLDIIFIIDPRKGPYKKYSHNELYDYSQKHKIKLIHIVNECDKKRQKNISLEPIILDSISKSDQVVFISNWLKDYYTNTYNINKPYKVINNAANTDIFKPNFQKKKIK